MNILWRNYIYPLRKEKEIFEIIEKIRIELLYILQLLIQLNYYIELI